MMKADFERYEVYKKSDSLWIDEEPVHWLRGRVKDFVDTNSITKIPKDMAEEMI